MMEEDEADLYVNVATAGQEDDDWQEPDDSWLELDGGESKDNRGVYCVNAFMGGEDSGLEEEFEYCPGVSPDEDMEEKAEEDRWLSPDLSWLQSEEKDEEETCYLNNILSEKRDVGEEQVLASPFRGNVAEKTSPASKEGKAKKRRKLRKKGVGSSEEAWESTRKDAWLRGLLSSSSEDESEGKYARFEESGRRIAEIGGQSTGAKTSDGIRGR
jgi:hypothetical protein